MGATQPEKILIADRVEKYIAAARRGLGPERSLPWAQLCDKILRAAIVEFVEGKVQGDTMVFAMNGHGELLDIDSGEQICSEKGVPGSALIAARIDQVVRQ
jgi:hypothetical protein